MTKITLNNDEVIETYDSLSTIIQYSIATNYINANALIIIDIDKHKRIVKISNIKSVESI